MSQIIWDGTKDIEIPVNVAVCPECGAPIVADVFEVTSEDGETNWHLEHNGSGLHIQCSKEDKDHYKMPYVDWLPIDDVVISWLNKNVQFGNAAEQSVHWIGGESAPLPALSTHEVDSIGGADTTPPANQ